MDKVLLTDDRRIISLDDVETCGDNIKLKLFDKIGLNAKYTDFAIALGAETVYDDDSKPVSTYQLKCDVDRIGNQVVVGDFIFGYATAPKFCKGVRLVTNLPVDKELDIEVDDNYAPFVFFDEYPQTIASRYTNNGIITNGFYDGDNYIVPNPENEENGYKSLAKEITFCDRKYVELPITNFLGNRVLSDRTEINNGMKVLFKVEPIKWYVDLDTGLCVSEKVLSTSIPLDYVLNHQDNVKRLTKKSKNQ